MSEYKSIWHEVNPLKFCEYWFKIICLTYFIHSVWRQDVQTNGLDVLYVALTLQSEMCVKALSLHQVPWNFLDWQTKQIMIWLLAMCSSAHSLAGNIGDTPTGASLYIKHVWHLKLWLSTEIKFIWFIDYIVYFQHKNWWKWVIFDKVIKVCHNH